MNWLTISITGYLLNAISLTINKSLLGKDIPSPNLMAILIGFFGMVTIVFIPFGVKFLPTSALTVSFIAGGAFTAAIYSLFYALQKGSASNIPALIGGIQPIILFVIAASFLGEKLSHDQFIGYIFLITGGLIIALSSRYSGKILLMAFLSSIFFAISNAATKWVFDASDFISGFFWIRVGAFIAGLLMLTNVASRNELKKLFSRKNKIQNKRAASGFLSAQVTGGVGVILINYAFSIGSVTLTNAMQGIQYVFLFLIILSLGIFYPKFIKENLSKKVLVINLAAIIAISIGLYFIAF
jgi:drug/metabolite transporter (DMT)-like permease